MQSLSSDPCWITTDDKAGTRAQAQALTAAMGLSAVVKTVTIKPFFSWLPLVFIKHWPWIYQNQDEIKGAAPSLVIAAGRGAVPVALQLKQRGASVVFLQNPYIDPGHFDLVIAPQHDGLQGRNVLQTIGALSKINAFALQEAQKEWQDRLAHFPSPRIAVLIGGKSGVYNFDAKYAEKLCDQLLKLQQEYGGSLWVTASRRTGHEAAQILQDKLKGPNILFWDGTGDNPYAAFLALADFIVVTEDSVSMHCEAAATGKPIYTLQLPLRPKSRIKNLFRQSRSSRFHAMLQGMGISRFFNGRLDHWSYPVLDEAQRIAPLVLQKLEEKI